MVLALIFQGELLIFQSPLSRSSLKTKTTESDRYAKTIFGTIGGGLHYRGSLPFYSLTKIEKNEAHPTFRVMRQSCSAYSLSLKYLSSLKPYALRFITFILLFIPSTLAVEI